VKRVRTAVVATRPVSRMAEAEEPAAVVTEEAAAVVTEEAVAVAVAIGMRVRLLQRRPLRCTMIRGTSRRKTTFRSSLCQPLVVSPGLPLGAAR
jgi:hypothetical protein